MAYPSQRPGVGAVPYDGGATFRVWAPHAEQVFVAGDVNGWHGRRDELGAEHDDRGQPTGWFSGDVTGAWPGGEYRFVLVRPGADDLWRIDPQARAVTSSVGNAVITDLGTLEVGEDTFTMPPWEDLVIYELHVGTFQPHLGGRGTLASATSRLGYLSDLGISAVELMPLAEFAGDVSWGYNPAHPFALESSYGSPQDLADFVRAAHAHGIAVIVDVVVNHLGPSDLPTWQFDGWAPTDHGEPTGGIYFFTDHRRHTPWGQTRPDYGRAQVREFLRDAVLLWLEAYHADGLRFDATNYVRRIDGVSTAEENQLPQGWELLRWLNDEIDARQPWAVTIAEDLQRDPAIVTPTCDGGAGFSGQWDAEFVHTVRAAIIGADDERRDVPALAEALAGVAYRGIARRVVYTESHDEVANGSARVPEIIDPGGAGSWWALKRAMLGSALVLTAPGTPMLFQGQEFAERGSFDDTRPLDWDRAARHTGLVTLHRDLITLRRNRWGRTAGLRGEGLTVLRATSGTSPLLVFHRYAEGGPGDDVVVAVNLGAAAQVGVGVGFPAPGRWRLELNSDARGYHDSFGGFASYDVDAHGPARDGCGQSGSFEIGPYTTLVWSRSD